VRFVTAVMGGEGKRLTYMALTKPEEP